MIEPMRTIAETRMANDGQNNAGGTRRLDGEGRPYYDAAPLSDYPRMLYKKTDVEQFQDSADPLGKEKTVINSFGGMLCDMCIAHSQTEAEALAEMGWETSPSAAYGITQGLGQVVSAKDERIAELEALLAQRNEQAEKEPVRRGRPPKVMEGEDLD